MERAFIQMRVYLSAIEDHGSAIRRFLEEVHERTKNNTTDVFGHRHALCDLEKESVNQRAH